MKVLVAMSGGVDSSVAAALVRDAGHDAVGVKLKLWGGESDTGCCSVADVDDARRAADRLGLDHHVFNLGAEFDRSVVQPYVVAHSEGRTPNPCVECNRHIKFGALLTRASQLGFEAVATGHHARISSAGRVARGADRAKDQSYVVGVMTRDQLRQVVFPIGAMTKAEVRARAAELGLPTAAKPDSQEVCFIRRDVGRAGFVGGRRALTPGTVVDGEGRAVGRVEAVELVTIGQRRGLGLAGGHAPRYVVDVDVRSATVVVGDERDLLVEETRVGPWTWASSPVDAAVLVQCSAHGDALPAAIDGQVVRWAAPRRRVAPGQLVVAYAGNEVVGSAVADG